MIGWMLPGVVWMSVARAEEGGEAETSAPPAQASAPAEAGSDEAPPDGAGADDAAQTPPGDGEGEAAPPAGEGEAAPPAGEAAAPGAPAAGPDDSPPPAPAPAALPAPVPASLPPESMEAAEPLPPEVPAAPAPAPEPVEVQPAVPPAPIPGAAAASPPRPPEAPTPAPAEAVPPPAPAAPPSAPVEAVPPPAPAAPPSAPVEAVPTPAPAAPDGPASPSAGADLEDQETVPTDAAPPAAPEKGGPGLLRRLPGPRFHVEGPHNAYVLPWGKVEIGRRLQAGVWPRVQVGTSLLLDLLGDFNLDLEVEAVRRGPLSVSLGAGGHSGTLMGVGVGAFSADLTVTWAIVPALQGSVRVGWTDLAASGQPSVDDSVPAIVAAFTPLSSSDDLWSQLDQGRIEVSARMLRTSLALEWRPVRRHGVVGVFSVAPWGSGGFDLSVLPQMASAADLPFLAAGLDALEGSGVGPSGTWMAAAFYQFSGYRFDARLGAGIGPALWRTLPTVLEVVVHFGGHGRLDRWLERRRSRVQEASTPDA